MHFFIHAARHTTERPLDVLKSGGDLSRFIPDIAERLELRYFLHDFLWRTEEQRELRGAAQQEILNKIEVNTADRVPVLECIGIDVDHTVTMLYPISSTTGLWSLERLARLHSLDLDKLCDVAREIPAEYLCHSPRAFMSQMVERTGLQQLNPDNSANASIMQDWIYATRILNQQLFFGDVAAGIKQFKKEGGLIFIATAGPQANTLHRVYLGLGSNADQYIDAIAVRADLPGLDPCNRFASEEERALADRLQKNGQLIVIPEDEIKPHPAHLYKPMQRIEKMLGVKINPHYVGMLGDSLGSDGGSSERLAEYTRVEAQFVYTAKAVVADPKVLAAHARVGHPIDKLGAGPVLDRIHNGNYVHPHLAIVEFGEIFQNYRIEPPVSVGVDARNRVKQLLLPEPAKYELGKTSVN